MVDNVKVSDGTVMRTERVVVEYLPATRPHLEVELTRPYEVRATGAVSGTENYQLTADGFPARNAARVSPRGFLESLRAAYQAFRGIRKQGGISGADVADVQSGVNQYNALVARFDQVTSQQRVTDVKENEMRIDELSEEELSDLL